jgi:cbb3-type cytochrome oxidase maturation protein
MSIALLLIPLSLALLGVAIAAFFWAVDHDQFEDLDTVGEALLDLDPPAAGPADQTQG